jgi:hypothetical protein
MFVLMCESVRACVREKCVLRLIQRYNLFLCFSSWRLGQNGLVALLRFIGRVQGQVVLRCAATFVPLPRQKERSCGNLVLQVSG